MIRSFSETVYQFDNIKRYGERGRSCNCSLTLPPIVIWTAVIVIVIIQDLDLIGKIRIFRTRSKSWTITNHSN